MLPVIDLLLWDIFIDEKKPVFGRDAFSRGQHFTADLGEIRLFDFFKAHCLLAGDDIGSSDFGKIEDIPDDGIPRQVEREIDQILDALRLEVTDRRIELSIFQLIEALQPLGEEVEFIDTPLLSDKVSQRLGFVDDHDSRDRILFGDAGDELLINGKAQVPLGTVCFND